MVEKIIIFDEKINRFDAMINHSDEMIITFDEKKPGSQIATLDVLLMYILL